MEKRVKISQIHLDVDEWKSNLDRMYLTMDQYLNVPCRDICVIISVSDNLHSNGKYQLLNLNSYRNVILTQRAGRKTVKVRFNY